MVVVVGFILVVLGFFPFSHGTPENTALRPLSICGSWWWIENYPGDRNYLWSSTVIRGLERSSLITQALLALETQFEKARKGECRLLVCPYEITRFMCFKAWLQSHLWVFVMGFTSQHLPNLPWDLMWRGRDWGDILFPHGRSQ